MRPWIFGTVTSLAIALLAQERRDVPPVLGLGAISGIVQTTDDPSAPVRRALVRLTEPTLGVTLDAISDDAGRFSFAQLRDGRFGLVAMRPSFVTIAFGATRPGWPGSALVLTNGQQLSDLRVVLARGAVLTGTIRDAMGAPLPDIDVGVTNTLPQLRRTIVVRTDDRGTFRAFGLPAGPYVVSARPLRRVAVQRMSDAEVDREFLLLQQRRSQSVPLGSAGVAQRSGINQQEARADATERLADVFFPDGGDQDTAEVIRLAAGEERRGIDIVLRGLRTGSIAGQVTTNGQAARPFRVDVVRQTTAASSIAGDLRQDGAFRAEGVPAGRHTVLAWSASDRECRFASQDVFVDGQAIERMNLALRACPEIVGQIGWAREAPPAMPLSSLRLVLKPPPGSAPASRFPPRTASIDANGRFRFGPDSALLPGAYQLELVGPGGDATSMLGSMTADGRDVLDAPFIIEPDAVPTIRLAAVLNEQPSTLSGRLESPSGAPTTYLIIAFTTNTDLWREPFRRVRIARPAVDGQFSFAGLPPGEYFLAALSEVAPDEWRDPSFLREAVRASVRVTVVEGVPTVQHLRVSR